MPYTTVHGGRSMSFWHLSGPTDTSIHNLRLKAPLAHPTGTCPGPTNPHANHELSPLTPQGRPPVKLASRSFRTLLHDPHTLPCSQRLTPNTYDNIRTFRPVQNTAFVACCRVVHLTSCQSSETCQCTREVPVVGPTRMPSV